MRSEREPAGCREIRTLCIGVGDDKGKRPRFKGLLHGPKQARGFFQRDGEETAAGEAQGFEAVAIKPAIFTFFAREPAPQEWPAFRSVFQAAERQSQSKAHGSRHIAIGLRRHVMEAVAG